MTTEEFELLVKEREQLTHRLWYVQARFRELNSRKRKEEISHKEFVEWDELRLERSEIESRLLEVKIRTRVAALELPTDPDAPSNPLLNAHALLQRLFSAYIALFNADPSIKVDGALIREVRDYLRRHGVK